MKKLTLILALFTAITVQAQTETKTLSKLNTMRYTFIHSQNVNIDTFESVYISFLNDEYTTIRDHKVLYITDIREFEQLKDDLNQAFEQSTNKKKLTWTRDNYTISIQEKGSRVYIFADYGYTYFVKMDMKRILKWINQVKFQ